MVSYYDHVDETFAQKLPDTTPVVAYDYLEWTYIGRRNSGICAVARQAPRHIGEDGFQKKNQRQKNPAC